MFVNSKHTFIWQIWRSTHHHEKVQPKGSIEEVFLRLASQSTAMQNRQQEMLTVAAAADAGGGPTDAETDSGSPEASEEGNALGGGDDVFAPSAAHWRLQLAALLRQIRFKKGP